MRRGSTTVEQEIARIANRAHGIVTRAELLGCGISAPGIDRRIRKGILLPEYPGVYRVGHRAPSVEARYMAAVKACGEGAVLSGLAAAFLYGLISGTSPAPEVTAPARRRVKGLKTRRSKLILATKVRGIPVTTVAGTLVDIAPDLDDDELARACHKAGVRYGTTPRHVKAVLTRKPRAKGAKKLQRVMEGDVPVTLSKLEAALIARLRDANLPIPNTNKRAGSKRIDARWPGVLTAEIDSYRYHNSRHSWEGSYEREREAHGRDEQFRRYTYRDVMEDPTRMLAELRKLLSPNAPSTPLPRPPRRGARSEARASRRAR